MKNPDLPKLLRAIARGTQAQENKHDIIFVAAADELDDLRAENEQLRRCIKTLDLDMGVLVSIINDRKPTPKTATL